jgi:hypothetical protein
MYLSQEYLERHGLEVKHAVYDEIVNLVLRSDNFQWLVLHGEWRPPTLHPGYYVFQMFRPIHNGCERQVYGQLKLFEEITNQTIIHWDEFELFIHDWVRKYCSLRLLGFQAVEKQKEAELACWEMFLYTHDKWLSENMDSSFFDLVMGSTMPDLSFVERRDSYLYAMEMLKNHLPVISALQNTILTYAKKKNYSEWLAKLVNTSA